MEAIFGRLLAGPVHGDAYSQGIANWQPTQAELAFQAEAMRQAQRRPMDWSLLQCHRPSWLQPPPPPPPPPLEERFAAFKKRLAEARARHP